LNKKQALGSLKICSNQQFKLQKQISKTLVMIDAFNHEL